MTNKDNGGPASDKIQQARRAAFESSLETRNRQRAESGFDALKPDEVRQMWWAFNAALDCVVIELPQELRAYSGQPQEDRLLDVERNHTIKLCRAAIESTNLGIKVK